jgi:hypothetical protein
VIRLSPKKIDTVLQKHTRFLKSTADATKGAEPALPPVTIYQYGFLHLCAATTYRGARSMHICFRR